MADLNTMLHEVCEYEDLTMTHIFVFKPGSFQLQLGLDGNGYIFQIMAPPPRLNTPVVDSSSIGQRQRMFDSYQSSVMTDFSSKLIGALGTELAEIDQNCDVAEWLKAELKKYLFRRRGLVGTVSYHWNKRKTRTRD